MAKDLLRFINGSSPYLLPKHTEADYQPGDSGNIWDTILEYGHVTGDNQYRDNASAALLSQRGLHNDFLPDSSNLTSESGPAMQSNWALAAMTAAERGVPNSKGSKDPRWIDLAQNTFEFQMRFFDEDAAAKNGSTCGGGLRLAYLPDGEVTPYDWKPSDPDGALFNLAARLHRFTGNATYADAATRIWDWMVNVGYLDPKMYNISSGEFASNDCKGDPKYDYQLSRTNALFLLGAAHMYNATSSNGNSNSTEWQHRVTGLQTYAWKAFLKDSVVYEAWCEMYEPCDEYIAFKGVFVRDYAQAAQVAPFIADKVVPVLQSTAMAVVRRCTLGSSGRECGFFWAGPPEITIRPGNHTDDVNANTQSSALSAILAVLTAGTAEPYTAANSPNKGDDTSSSPDDSSKDDSTGKDGKSNEAIIGRAQASVAAIVMLALLVL